MSEEEMQRLEWMYLEQYKPRDPPVPPLQGPTIPYTDLPEVKSDDPSARNWNFYRREVGRLLAEGNEGKWVLIKDEKIVGIWENQGEAVVLARERNLTQPTLLHQILRREPVVRGPWWLGLCHN